MAYERQRTGTGSRYERKEFDFNFDSMTIDPTVNQNNWKDYGTQQPQSSIIYNPTEHAQRLGARNKEVKEEKQEKRSLPTFKELYGDEILDKAAHARLMTQEVRLDRLAKQTTPQPQMDNRMQSSEKLDPFQSIQNFEAKLPKGEKEIKTGIPAIDGLVDWYDENVRNSFIGKAISRAEKADRAISNAKAGVLDSASFGISQGIGRAAINSLPGGKENLQPIMDDRIDSTSYKVGEIAGYIPPGAAIERGVAGALKPIIKNAGPVLRGATTAGVAGLAEGVVQESGDDLFRNQTFDPESVLLSGAAGAGLGAALPLIGKGISKGADALGWTRQRSAAQTTPTPTGGADEVEQEVAATTEFAPAMNGNWFTNLFGNQGVGISAAGSNARIRSGPLTTGDQVVNKAVKKNKEGLISIATAHTRAGYQNLVDYLSPLNKLGEDTYEKAMDAVRANNIANTIVRDKFVTPEGVVVGEGLENIFRKVARGQDKQFIDYIILRHAMTRMGRGEKVYDDSLNMTIEKVAERIQTLQNRHKGFEDIAKEWDQFNDNMLKTYGVKEGLLSEEMYKSLRDKNPNYAPMRRQFTLSERPGQRAKQFMGTNTSFSGQKAPIREVSKTGSTRRIVDPRRSTIEATSAWTNAAMRNRTLQGVAQRISADPDAFKGVVEIVQKPKDMRDLKEIILNDGEEEFIETLNNEISNLFKRTNLDKDNIIRVMVNGEPIHLQVHDPEVIKAILGMGPQASNIMLDVLSMFSNATKRGATGLLAPMFAVKGATMDLAQSAIQAKNPIQQVAYSVYAIFSGIGDKLHIPGLRNWAQEFRRAGGEYSAALKGDRRVDQRISSMKRHPIISAPMAGRAIAGALKLPFKTMEAIGNVAENAPRIAAYKADLARSGAKTPGNVRAAMSAARESTVNFSRKGAWTRDIEALVPYNNAALQGAYRVARGIKKNPVRTVAAIGTLAVLPKIYEYAMFADDEDYQKIPARERYRNLIVSKNDDGTFVKIPMEPAYNSIGELTIESLRKFKDGDQDAFKGFQDALANAWTPPVVTGALQGMTQNSGPRGSIVGAFNSTVAAPFTAIAGNQSFTGAPIVPQDLADRSPANQFDEKTTAAAKWIGDKINMSPKEVDYLLTAYGGDAARLLGPLTSTAGSGTARNTLLKNFIADPTLTNTLSTDFYRATDRIIGAHADFNEVGDSLPSWYSEDIYKMVTSKAEGMPLKQLSELRALKREVNTDKKLSAQQKHEKIRGIQKQMNEIFIKVNAELKANGVPGM